MCISRRPACVVGVIGCSGEQSSTRITKPKKHVYEAGRVVARSARILGSFFLEMPDPLFQHEGPPLRIVCAKHAGRGEVPPARVSGMLSRKKGALFSKLNQPHGEHAARSADKLVFGDETIHTQSGEWRTSANQYPIVYASSYLSQKSLQPVILSTVRRAVAYCFKTSKKASAGLYTYVNPSANSGIVHKQTRTDFVRCYANRHEMLRTSKTISRTPLYYSRSIWLPLNTTTTFPSTKHVLYKAT